MAPASRIPGYHMFIGARFTPRENLFGPENQGTTGQRNPVFMPVPNVYDATR